MFIVSKVNELEHEPKCAVRHSILDAWYANSTWFNLVDKIQSSIVPSRKKVLQRIGIAIQAMTKLSLTKYFVFLFNPKLFLPGKK